MLRKMSANALLNCPINDVEKTSEDTTQKAFHKTEFTTPKEEKKALKRNRLLKTFEIKAFLKLNLKLI